jgi:membrane-bound ClpP family serine protease
MGDILAISALVIVGLLLIVIELLFVPGTTIVGIAGFFLALIGVYLSYKLFGTSTGHTVLAITAVSGLVSCYLGFKSKIWHRFALNTSLLGRANDQGELQLHIGETGITVSTLRPSGNAEFNHQVYEVHTQGRMVERGIQVKIISIDKYKIIVEPINFTEINN